MSGILKRLRRRAEATIEELFTVFLHALSVVFFAAMTAAANYVRLRLLPGLGGWPIVTVEIGFGLAFVLRTSLLVHVYWRRLSRSGKKKP